MRGAAWRALCSVRTSSAAAATWKTACPRSPKVVFVPRFPRSSSGNMSTSSSQPSSARNRLAKELSPYLLQHAGNPVDWYPWGPEAFEAARRENKLIFLSVGYSTCHWCHVMERESFCNPEVAELMNKDFINVKVDREERPDVDKVYMTFVQATSGGRGGWPMSVFLTPELKPVYGGTYFPPEDVHPARTGFKTVLSTMAEQWRKNGPKMADAGDHILEVLREIGSRRRSGGSRGSSSDREEAPAVDPGAVASRCFAQLADSYDEAMGGFSVAPKFPQPVNLNFLMDFYYYNNNGRKQRDARKALDMALHTLKAMSRGGINDHVSKGFARYSTDRFWKLPHFEKMLYDQAQLCTAYAQAYCITKDMAGFGSVAKDILEYVLRDLRHPLGGFYSAEDADSYPEEEEEAADPPADAPPGHPGPDKMEGAFCLWTWEQLTALLGQDRARLFGRFYGCRPQGNLGDHDEDLRSRNVLTAMGADEALLTQLVADHAGLLGGPSAAADQAPPDGGGGDVDERLRRRRLDAVLEECRRVLYEARSKRPKPDLDDKVLASWNGLMISGLCAAGTALDDPSFVAAASKAASFLKEHLWNDSTKTLYRSAYSSRGGGGGEPLPDQVVVVDQLDRPIEGFLDDHAFLIQGLLDLYEAEFDSRWLFWAEELQGIQDRLFWDGSSGGYFTSSVSGDPHLVMRMKEEHDGAEPSGNSVSVRNLMRLSALTGGGGSYGDKARQTVAASGQLLKKAPAALPEMVRALPMLASGPTTIIVTGRPEECEETKKLIRAVHSAFLPDKVLILADGNDTESFPYQRLETVRNMAKEKPGMAFVCRNNTCSLPTSSPEELMALLSSS